MTFPDGLGDRAIQDVVRDYPQIGAILERHGIGCVTCSVGICLLKDVVSIHGLSAEDEAQVEREIGAQLAAGTEAAEEDALCAT